MPRDTKGSTTTSSTCRPAAEPGNANCRRLIPPYFMAGVLTAASYFTAKSEEESEIRELAEILYRRVDWQWALNEGTTICHGWKPESGFLPYRWDTGYSEALILYVLALGSPTFPIDPQGYQEWISTFEWKKVYDIEYLYAGPLFIHQMSHLWLDFRGIHDDFNRKTGIDYFENSRRATYVQQTIWNRESTGICALSQIRLGTNRERRTGTCRPRGERRPKEYFSTTLREARHLARMTAPFHPGR